MDFSFHIQQGQQLLQKQDVVSVEKALEHFKKANEMAEEGGIEKPKTLYYLAYGNLIIGNIEQAYKIAYKAKRSLDTAVENSIFSMNNMRQMLGEDDIDSLINHIDEEYSQFIIFTDTEDDNFDENELDFSLVSKIYSTVKKQEIKPQFSANNLSVEVLMATFLGLSRTDDELIYFDRLKGDVLSYVQGYFSSHLGDQSVSNKVLVNKITNSEPTDHLDEDRYVLIDRLRLTDFLTEYKNQAKGREPFSSFVEYFSVEVLKDFTNDDLTIDNLSVSNHVQDKFQELFAQKYQSRIYELRDLYANIFDNTCRALSTQWIKKNIAYDDVEMQDSKPNHNMNFVFKSSDHLRYENGIHVSGPHGGAGRAVKVESNIKGSEGQTVTMFNLDGPHPLWQNNVQMAPKQMKVIEEAKSKVVLRGYGRDAMGASFADYGLTIHYQNGEPHKCVLHMHDRGVDIEYLP